MQILLLELEMDLLLEKMKAPYSLITQTHSKERHLREKILIMKFLNLELLQIIYQIKSNLILSIMICLKIMENMEQDNFLNMRQEILEQMNKMSLQSNLKS
jgi:hypothetical protein